MILQQALCNLRDELMESGWFNRFYDYAEIVEKGEKSSPQHYIGKGNYKPIYDLDVNGTGYNRLVGSIIMMEVPSQGLSCDTDPLVEVTYPLRMVVAVPKAKLQDSSYSDHGLALDLMSYINKKQSAVTGMMWVKGKVNRIELDRNVVFSQEVRGPHKQVDLKLSYIALDYTLTFKGVVSCFQENCYGNG